MNWFNPVPAGGRLTSNFGPRGSGFHAGQDIAPPTPGKQGLAIVSAHSGTVVAVGTNNVLAGHSGTGILIQHVPGVNTYYGHLAGTIVKVGDEVRDGQRIGTMGYTGNTIPRGPQGTHLHFGVILNGRYVDPVSFMQNRGAPLGKPYKAPETTPIQPSQQTIWIQQALRNMGYDPGPVDGILGDRTRGAIRVYQRDNGLFQDGNWGPVTERHYQYVRRLQGALNRWRAVQPKLVVDGSKGKITRRAIWQVQKANPKLFGRADGVDGPMTRRALGI